MSNQTASSAGRPISASLEQIMNTASNVNNRLRSVASMLGLQAKPLASFSFGDPDAPAPTNITARLCDIEDVLREIDDTSSDIINRL